MKTDDRETASVDQLEHAQPTVIIPAEVVDKIQNGGDALEFLREGHQPYSKEEEKRVMHKVDVRMLALMLIVNGCQFVDKNVGLPPVSSYLVLLGLIVSIDNVICWNLWPVH